MLAAKEVFHFDCERWKLVGAAREIDRHVVLHQQAAANDFDVDGHSLAVWRSCKSRGDGCWEQP